MRKHLRPHAWLVLWLATLAVLAGAVPMLGLGPGIIVASFMPGLFGTMLSRLLRGAGR